jgi:membrane protease YdiL (CAAX protease family)
MAGLGVTGNMLVVVTEELIYRSLFLPPLTSWLGLYPAVAVTATVFGLAHVIPFGRLGIPVPEIIGGLLMAAAVAFSASSVAPFANGFSQAAPTTKSLPGATPPARATTTNKSSFGTSSC